MNKVRCAIYTRKSSEEGLEQDFNSLHAQREACAAYVLSQASEGWSLLPGEYDDGGLSGGTLERPALRRLLTDIEAGKIDIVVVYKVDRLTRSLLDFSKLVEAFDKAGASFVSVTQSFNTTTSMGRLTLNMLLSFAQFEREVTAERIRDKIAASKAKGMWMGGVCPLGYRPDGRSLAIVDEHAEVIRHLYRRYLQVGTVRELARELEDTGVFVPNRSTASGRALGGGTFKRGQLYAILANPVYVGEIHHKGCAHPGQHQAIVDRELWDRAQAMLAANSQGTQRGASTPAPNLLAGIVFSQEGEPLICVHASKGKVRYRYYVSKGLQSGASKQGIRISASELDKAVAHELAIALDQPLLLVERAGLELQPGRAETLRDRSAEAAAQLRERPSSLIRQLVTKVQVTSDWIGIDVNAAALASHVNLNLREGAPEHLLLQIRAQLRRSGKVLRLIDADQLPVRPTPQPAVVQLLTLAKAWWQEILSEQVSVSELARRHKVDKTYVSRVVRLNHLAPPIIERLLAGNHQARLDATRLVGLRDIPLAWEEQEKLLLTAWR